LRYICIMKPLHIYIIIAAITAVMLLGISPIAAQEHSSEPLSALSFASHNIDFGTIREDGGSVVRTVEAINRGTSDIVVSEIISTCGCTTIDFKPRTVASGELFTFAVRYDPMNRPGRIDKSIYVRASDSEEMLRLRLVGFVLERERSTEELYPFDMGCGLRLRSNFHAFGYLEAGEQIRESIAYINTSDRTLELEVEGSALSPQLLLDAPRHIEPGASGDIIIGYATTADEQVYGTIVDNITLYICGTRARYDITTQVIATDNFASTDDISAPKVDISKNIIKFGEVNRANTICEAETTVHNVGHDPLIIRCIESTSEALTCGVIGFGSGEEVTIASGKSATLSIKLDTSHYANGDDVIVERVRIITNDPMRPMQTIKVGAIPMW